MTPKNWQYTYIDWPLTKRPVAVVMMDKRILFYSESSQLAVYKTFNKTWFNLV